MSASRVAYLINGATHLTIALSRIGASCLISTHIVFLHPSPRPVLIMQITMSAGIRIRNRTLSWPKMIFCIWLVRIVTKYWPIALSTQAPYNVLVASPTQNKHQILLQQSLKQFRSITTIKQWTMTSRLSILMKAKLIRIALSSVFLKIGASSSFRLKMVMAQLYVSSWILTIWNLRHYQKRI